MSMVKSVIDMEAYIPQCENKEVKIIARGPEPVVENIICMTYFCHLYL
jgi:hypothetical protein